MLGNEVWIKKLIIENYLDIKLQLCAIFPKAIFMLFWNDWCLTGYAYRKSVKKTNEDYVNYQEKLSK